MKNLRYMLIAVYSAFLLLPLGSCMDTDMNRNKYEVDSEEIGRENYDLGSTIRGLQGLVIPAQEHLYQFMEAMCGKDALVQDISVKHVPDGWRNTLPIILKPTG